MADWFIATESVKVVKDSASFWSIIIAPASALAGVVIGQYIAWQIAKSSERRKQESEQAVICAQLIIRLREFEHEYRVIADDQGVMMPSDGWYEERKPQFYAKELSFADIQGNWASLPGKLLFRIQSLPFRHKEIERFLGNEHAIEGDFPHQVPYFRERQTRYRNLANECEALINELILLCRFTDITTGTGEE